jgi:hypothetical protein
VFVDTEPLTVATVLAVILFIVVFAFMVTLELNVALPDTVKVEFTVAAEFMIVAVVFVTNTFAVELARIQTFSPELTTIAGPVVLPVVAVKFVVPFTVLIVVVVKDDIR